MAKKAQSEPDFILPEAGALVHKRATVPQSRRVKRGGGPPISNRARRLFLKVYEQSYGSISYSCVTTGISRRTYYRWKARAEADRQKDPATLGPWARRNVRFFDAIALIRPVEKKKDLIEAALVKRIEAGSDAAIIFGAKTIARDRGYIERPDLNAAAAASEADSTIAIELQKLRQQIERVAVQFETDYKSELREFLDVYGRSLAPAIRTELVSELEN